MGTAATALVTNNEAGTETALENVRPTDVGPPQRTSGISREVRVIILPHASQAFLHTKDGSIQEWVPIGRVSVRMLRGEREAYFKAEIESGTHVLHLGDRIPHQGW